MSNDSPYDIDSYSRVASVGLGELLTFFAGRFIGVRRETTTAFFHVEVLLYSLDDLGVESNGSVIPEYRSKNYIPHDTGALAMGGSQMYSSPKLFVANNTTNLIFWSLNVPFWQPGVNGNPGPYKQVSVFVPNEESYKFRIVEKVDDNELRKRNR